VGSTAAAGLSDADRKPSFWNCQSLPAFEALVSQL